jgi:hypothetical protein
MSAQRCRSCGESLQEAEDDRPWERRPAYRGGRRDAEPHRGTLILVLGILSIVTSMMLPIVAPVLGIIAMILGRSDMKKIRKNEMDREGLGTTQAGWVCGIVGTVLGSLCCVAWVLYIGGVMTFAMAMSKQQQQGRPPAFRQVQPGPQQPQMPADDDVDDAPAKKDGQ